MKPLRAGPERPKGGDTMFLPIRKLCSYRFSTGAGLLLGCLLAASLAAQEKSQRHTRAGCTGCDSFGYVLYDQSQPECRYEFLDISVSGTPVSFTASGAEPAADDGGALIALDEAFELYGESVSHLVMSTNGYLAVGSSLVDDEDGGDFSNDWLPTVPGNAVAAIARLMPYHNDLSGFDSGGTAQVEHFPACPRTADSGIVEGCTVFQWTNWGLHGTADVFSFQAILYHTSFEIVFQVGGGDSTMGEGSSVGIQDRQAKIGLAYATNSREAIPAETAICIFEPRFSAAGTVADLAVRQTDGVETAGPGDNLVYTIAVENRGPSPVSGAEVTDDFPTSLVLCGWTCDSSPGASCSASGSDSIADMVSLPVEGWLTYTASCTVDVGAAGPLVNTASVQPPAGVSDPNPADNTSSDTDIIAPEADLGISIDDGNDTVAAGLSLTYTITVSNSGPDAANSASVNTDFPAKLTDCSWACSASPGSSCTASGGGGLNDIVDLLAGGGASYTATCDIRPDVSGDLRSGAWVAAAVGTSDADSANNVDSDSTHLIHEANLGIAIDNDETTLAAGGTVTYTISAENSGPGDVTEVTVVDSFEAPLENCAWTCVGSGGGQCSPSGTGSILDGSVALPLAGSVTYTAICNVASDSGGLWVVNTASVAVPGWASDPEGSNNSATDSDPVIMETSIFADGFESGATNAWSSSLP